MPCSGPKFTAAGVSAGRGRRGGSFYRNPLVPLATVGRLGRQSNSMAPAHAQHEPDPVTLVAYHRALAEHSEGLKSYATRMLGDGIAAEDVCQDSFLALYRHLHQVPPGAYRPWLYRVARNLCLDQLRRRKFKLSLFRDLSRDDDQPFVPSD